MNYDEMLWRYNVQDCCRTLEADASLQRTVDAFSLREPHDFQQSLFWPVLQTMLWGIAIDTSHQDRLILELTFERELALLEIDFVVGHSLNIGSPKQVQEFFYVELGQQPVLKRRGKGAFTPSTDDESLHKVAERQPLLRPLVEKILYARSLSVYLNTFLAENLDFDGRMRCSYNIAGTTTFRFSSQENPFGSGMNLQNVPVLERD